MLRSNRKGQNSFNSSSLNASLLSSETTAETMERQIDNYTRRLEQDKRKFFRAQQNFSEIKKNHDNKNKELQTLKSKKNKTQMAALKGKIVTLQAALEQTINSYNQSLAKNNKLKCEIDQLRKDKKNEHEKLRFLNQRVGQIGLEMQEKQIQIEKKKSVIQQMKQSIIKVKQTNESQVKQHEQQIISIKQNFSQTGKENDRKKKQQKSLQPQNIDTQPIVKLRLRNLIAKNKQKIKIIDHYKKNMHLIHQSFEEIMEQSGVQDLEEITKTFLKQEEQNLFIYEYMSRLNSTIEEMRQSNQEITKKIQQQQEENRQRRITLSGTPEEAKRRRQFESYKEQKSKKFNELKAFLDEIKPKMMHVFRQYGLIRQDEYLYLDQSNIQSYIAQMQDLINSSKGSLEMVYKGEFKEDLTRYTKSPPAISEDPKEKPEERLLQKQKLNQIAGDYWQRKKGNKMASSKANDVCD